MTIAQSHKVRAYPAPELIAYMEQQADLFEKAKAMLIEQFLDRYVWFEDGHLVVQKSILFKNKKIKQP